MIPAENLITFTCDPDLFDKCMLPGDTLTLTMTVEIHNARQMREYSQWAKQDGQFAVVPVPMVNFQAAPIPDRNPSLVTPQQKTLATKNEKTGSW